MEQRYAPPREAPPNPHRRERPPPSLRTSTDTPREAASSPKPSARAERPGGVPPFNRLQLAAALIEYDDEDGARLPTAVPIDSPELHEGAFGALRTTKRAADSAIFTPYRTAPKQLDYFSDIELPGGEAGSDARRRYDSKTSMGSSGFGLATTASGTRSGAVGEEEGSAQARSSSLGSGRATTRAGSEGVRMRASSMDATRAVEEAEPAAEEDETETLAEWGLDGLLSQLGTGQTPRPRLPSRARTIGDLGITIGSAALPGARSDGGAASPPPPSPRSDTHSLPDVLDRRIFRPPSSASHPLLKGHAILATRNPSNQPEVLPADAVDRRRAQSFDVVRRPTDLSPASADFPSDENAPRQRRVTMLDRPHAADGLEGLKLPTPQWRVRPVKGHSAKPSTTPSTVLGRTSADIVERYRQSIAMLTEPMDFATEAQRDSNDFTVPLPSEYTSRFDPKVAELMQRHKERDAELNAQSQSVPEVIIEGEDGTIELGTQKGGRVFDEQNRIRFPGSLNPKVLVMPAPLTPPELEGIDGAAEGMEQGEEGAEEPVPPPHVERPAGKLYGRSLIDELRERQAAQKSRKRAFAGDNRPRMFVDSQSMNDIASVASDKDHNTVAFPTSRSTGSLASPKLNGPSEAVAHARSLYASAALASSRANASVFGIDMIMQRELEKVRKIEEIEAAEREEERKHELAEEARKEAKKGNKKKKKAREGEEAGGTVEPSADGEWRDATQQSIKTLADAPRKLDVPTADRRAPSLDLPTAIRQSQSGVDMDHWFDEGDSSSDDDSFSDANSIARRLESKSPSGLPTLLQSGSGSVATYGRSQSVLSHAANFAVGAPRPDSDSSSDDEPLSSLAQKHSFHNQASHSRESSLVRDRSPALSLNEVNIASGFGAEVLSSTTSKLPSPDGRRPERPADDSDSDDEPLGIRLSVHPPARLNGNDSDGDDMPLAIRASSMSIPRLNGASHSTLAPPIASFGASATPPKSARTSQADLGLGRPSSSFSRSQGPPLSQRRPSVPSALASAPTPSLGVAVNGNDENAALIASPTSQVNAGNFPTSASQHSLNADFSFPNSPRSGSPYKLVSASPAVSSARSSPVNCNVARQGTLAALEGNAVADEDAEDEVPLGYSRALFVTGRRQSGATNANKPSERHGARDDDDDDDDDKPLGFANPMAAATQQVHNSQTMLLLMQQQNAAFAAASQPVLPLANPYAFGGAPFPQMATHSPAGAGSNSFLSHDHAPGFFQHPQEAGRHESISRWRVGIEAEPPA